MENKLVPKIRFSEFTNDWEQRKLGEISNKIVEKNKNNLFSETLTNSAEYGIITQRDFFDKDISNEINLDGYYVVHENDFVYNPRISNFAPVGPIKRNKLSRTGIMSPLYYVFRTHSINKSYLEYFFDSTGWHSFMKLNGDSGARADRFAIKDSVFREMPIPFPNLDEQIKIGKFFEKLSNLITLHQRKLDMLKKMKHAYLQQMFAENGESMPRLRFADFDGEWEQRKLGELVDTVKSYSLSRDVETSEHTGFRYVHYGDIHKKIADLIKDDSILPIIKAGEYELLQKDDVIVADASEDYIGIAEPSIILENPKDKIVAGLHTIAMRPKEIDSLFLYYLLHTNRFKRFGNKVGTGMKVFGITTNNLYKFIVLMPNIKEQVKIGTFFKQLDDNITLNQTKLDKLKLIKNVYLQKMFI